ncbi:AraC family transcriptional regulator [Winogradskyella sp.]|uniref:AraC family transcriptional regulator n=1 Tax=Winogradskyella sp. TaxID=1883156 RepID=UPI003BABE553
MQPVYQKLSIDSPIRSFANFWVMANRFDVHWHYHPEVEICYVKSGEGQRIIGDSVNQFVKDDLVLLGSNLPHTWVTSDAFNSQNTNMEVYVVQFNIETLLNIDSKAFSHIKKLLSDAQRGISFKGSKRIKKRLLKINKAVTDYQKVITLFNLLNEMAASEKKEYLASPFYSLENNHKSEVQISKVCDFIYKNYREQISVSQLAELVDMNITSFCRFFKRNTGKTCVNFINDLRINYAASLLLNSKRKIFEVAFDSGFQSLTHFNKTFKKIMDKTPAVYQLEFANARKHN